MSALSPAETIRLTAEALRRFAGMTEEPATTPSDGCISRFKQTPTPGLTPLETELLEALTNLAAISECYCPHLRELSKSKCYRCAALDAIRHAEEKAV